MVMLVSLQEAKDHLRVDTSDGDNDLTLKINAASNAVLNYLKRTGLAYELDTAGYPLRDTAGDKIVLPEVQAAVLIMLGVICIDRDAKDFVDGGNTQTLGELHMPRTVKWLLDPLREPSHA